MMWRDYITLVSIFHNVNEYGDAVESTSSVAVFANKKSVRQSEFYQAHATGLKPEIMFEVRTLDYAKQPRLKHDNTFYNIIRTHSKNDEVTELVCSGLVLDQPDF
jgi:SPP1 family predicted phage head-tail adaptor